MHKKSQTKQLIFTSVFIVAAKKGHWRYVCMSVHASIHLVYLWLGEHVQAPGAHLAISGNADQVVGILGSHHIHAVDWVLHTVVHSSQIKKMQEKKNVCRQWKIVWSSALLCVQLQTGESSAQGCACCSCCPIILSVPSMSHPPQGWGETLQSRLTSLQTGETQQ